MKLTEVQLRRIIREALQSDPQRFLHATEDEQRGDDEGAMAKSRLNSLREMCDELCQILNDDDQLPGWVQDHLAVAHENLQQAHGYLMGFHSDA